MVYSPTLVGKSMKASGVILLKRALAQTVDESGSVQRDRVPTVLGK